MKINIIFYSLYGDMAKMAEAAAEGARKVPGAEVKIYRVAETLPADAIEAMGATEAQKALAHYPVADLDTLEEADALIFGVPTRYGGMSAQMRTYFDGTMPLWTKGALVGKVGSVMSSSATQHGGQEATILGTHVTLLHHGMVLVGLPYTFEGQSRVDEITGGSPYGASTITGPRGERKPSQNELDAAAFQGQRVAEIASKLAAK